MRKGFAGGDGLWMARGMAWVVATSTLSCSPNPGETSVAGSGHPICPQCEAVGGETSDFGSRAAPTMCEQSEQASPIDETEARALGFGVGLDALTRTFDAPFEWTPDDDEETRPVEGYEPLTRVTGVTAIRSIQHLSPTLEDCSDRIAIELSLSFRSEDGALSTEAPLSAVLTRDDATPLAFGKANLTDAEGSLRLFPPSFPLPLVGRIWFGLRFFPEGVRGTVIPYVSDAVTEESDSSEYIYEPLEGRWPADDRCSFRDLPLEPKDPRATPGGASAWDIRNELQATLDAHTQNAVWRDGTETTVTVHLGEPTEVCFNDQLSPRTEVSYVLPIALMSADGRLRYDGSANAASSFEGSGEALSNWLSVYESNAITVEQFREVTGIADADFGQARAAKWHAEVNLSPSIFGKLVLHPVDVDGSISGEENSFLEPILMLQWSE